MSRRVKTHEQRNVKGIQTYAAMSKRDLPLIICTLLITIPLSNAWEDNKADIIRYTVEHDRKRYDLCVGVMRYKTL